MEKRKMPRRLLANNDKGSVEESSYYGDFQLSGFFFDGNWLFSLFQTLYVAADGVPCHVASVFQVASFGDQPRQRRHRHRVTPVLILFKEDRVFVNLALTVLHA